MPTYHLTISQLPPKPQTFLSTSKHLNWIIAMGEEYLALLDNKTWVLVPRPTTRLIIGCKWVYRVKPSHDVQSPCFKA